MKHAMILLPILLCAAFARVAPAQQLPAKTASSNQAERNSKREGAITGRVVGPDGQPVADARVSAYRISERPGTGHSTESDDNGSFKLTGLQPGAYVLYASALGYVSAETPAENAIHRIGENGTISLVKGGVITGRVTDEAGEPIVGVSVISYRLRDPEGKTVVSRFGMFGYEAGRTDDRGVYRIYGLRPGVYIVSVGIGDDYWSDDVQVRRDAPTYYPSATRDTAVEINLRGGEEVSGVDIRHRGERGRIVSGVVSTVSGDIESVSIMLKAVEGGGFEATTSTDKTRGFVFYGAPDGEYELFAAREDAAAETTSSARRRISVRGADVSGVELKLAPSGSIAGRVTIESPDPPKRCAIKNDRAETSGQMLEQTERHPVVEEILLRAVLDASNPRATISGFFRFDRYGRPPNEKGEFAMKGLEAGRYHITANLPDDAWRIRAITQSVSGTGKQSAGASGATKKTVDISRNGVAIKPGEKLSGVEVIVAEDAATLSGRVVPAKDGMKLPSLLRAHLIPAEAASTDDVIRYAETDVRGDGSFEFKHVAPGKYLIHARHLAVNEVNDDQTRPAAWDAVGRARLRNEADAMKVEVVLKPCLRVTDQVVKYVRQP